MHEKMDGDPMSVSESKSGEIDGVHKAEESGQIDLSSLRAQFTSTPSPSLDQTMAQGSRFREEERLRSNLRRDRKCAARL